MLTYGVIKLIEGKQKELRNDPVWWCIDKKSSMEVSVFLSSRLLTPSHSTLNVL